jgi:hypothetical protein
LITCITVFIILRGAEDQKKKQGKKRPGFGGVVKTEAFCDTFFGRLSLGGRRSRGSQFVKSPHTGVGLVWFVLVFGRFEGGGRHGAPIICVCVCECVCVCVCVHVYIYVNVYVYVYVSV